MPLLQAHAAAHARRAPDSEAANDGTRRLSYGELGLRSSAIARCLGARGVGRGDLVLVAMKRSTEYLAAVLGVLEAGAAYVPLEVRTPPARRSQIVDDCRPRAVICDGALAGGIAASDLGRLPILVPEQLASASDGVGHGAPGGSASDEDDLACVLYTSGSTGTPKGVMLSHRNIDAYVEWAVERIGITAEDRLLGTAPFYFDMSLFDVYGSLRAGATLCIASERVLLFPKLLLELAEREGVTIWKGIASLLMYLSGTGALSPGRLPQLRAVLSAGEELPTKYLIDWMRTFPDKAFYNAYGPTEATGVSMYYRVPRVPAGADEKIPIGVPCENTVLHLLGDDRAPVAPGEIGEIALGGPCICSGYLGDPERSAEVFVDDPGGQGARVYLTGDHAFRRPDGNYELVGRRDDQVKVMGYRLELGDVERALTAIEGVREAGALLRPAARAGVDELVGYVVLDGAKGVAEVKAALRRALPFYMLPKHLYAVERLPRGDRGKLDRRALAALRRASQGASQERAAR